MITITRYETKYESPLKIMCQQEQIQIPSKDQLLDTFIVFDGKDVLGQGGYAIDGTSVELTSLYIRKNERLSKLGDSLFRGILNALYIQGKITVTMSQAPCYDAFMSAEDIECEDGEYKINLIEFFNRKCRSSRNTI